MVTLAYSPGFLHHSAAKLMVHVIPEGTIHAEPDWFFKVAPQQDGTYIMKTVEQTQDPLYARRRRGGAKKQEDRFLQVEKVEGVRAA